MNTKSKAFLFALITAASLPLFAHADTTSEAAPPAMTPAEPAAEAAAPMMMQGMMGMRHGMGPMTQMGDGQGKACKTKHGQMGQMGGMAPMGMQHQERKCHQKCDMKQGAVSDARINELEKRLDLLQSMVKLMASQLEAE